MGKRITVLLLLIMTLTACSVEEDTYSESDNIVISLESGIEKYTPTMSSVPGLPVKIKYVADVPLDQENVYISVKSSKGSFIHLTNGQITPVEDYMELSEQEITLYWSPIEEGDLFDVTESRVIVNLYINDLENPKVSAEGKIELDAENMYSFKNVQTVREGIYVHKETGKEIAFRSPHVTLMDNEFSFFRGGIGNNLAMGDYTVDKNTLTLTTNDEQYIYVFIVEKDTLIFQQALSSEIHVMISGMGIEVEDQAEFILETKI